MKLPTRIILGIRIEENYKNNKRISEFNHRSRKGYYVESALLEKIPMLDLSKKTEEKVAQTISNLEACYDM